MTTGVPFNVFGLLDDPCPSFDGCLFVDLSHQMNGGQNDEKQQILDGSKIDPWSGSISIDNTVHGF